MGKESRLQSWIMRALRDNGHYAVVICPPVEAGTPDILCCVNGIFVGLEVKTGKNKATRLQKHRLGQISDANGVSSIIRSKEDFWKLLSHPRFEKPLVGIPD